MRFIFPNNIHEKESLRENAAFIYNSYFQAKQLKWKKNHV